MLIIITEGEGIGIGALLIATVIGIFLTIFGFGYTVNMSGVLSFSSFGDFTNIISIFFRNVIPFTFGQTFDDYFVAKILVGGFIAYIVINTLAAIVTPKKLVVGVTTVISGFIWIYPLINFIFGEMPANIGTLERVVGYILGPILILCISAIPILVSTIINAIIFFAIRKGDKD